VSITVVATITPLAEHRGAVREALLAAIPVVHGEDGCELYSLHEADDRFVMVEQWSGREALAVHSAGAALVELGAALAGKVAGPAEVVVLDPVPAGDAVKGRLAG
jgi:quinol monooxygenase YgiN